MTSLILEGVRRRLIAGEGYHELRILERLSTEEVDLLVLREVESCWGSDPGVCGHVHEQGYDGASQMSVPGAAQTAPALDSTHRGGADVVDRTTRSGDFTSLSVT